MKKVYCWVVFVYQCVKERVEILLFSKDGVKYGPIYCRGKTCEQVRNYLHKLLGLTERDFFPDRDINWYKDLSVGYRDEKIFRICTSAARIRNDAVIKKVRGYKKFAWFNKAEAYEKLKHWKGYTRSFKRVFTDDTFWECVSTEK